MPGQSAPLRILVVEDEALLAMDIELIVEDCGHQVIATAHSLDSAEALEFDVGPDLALVDVQLARGSSGFDVSAMIQRRWPETVIVFVTANPKRIPADFEGAHGVIAKPFSRTGMMAALRYLGEGICRPPPTSPMPPGLVTSPATNARWAA